MLLVSIPIVDDTEGRIVRIVVPAPVKAVQKVEVLAMLGSGWWNDPKKARWVWRCSSELEGSEKHVIIIDFNLRKWLAFK